MNVIDLGFTPDLSKVSIQGGTFLGGVKAYMDMEDSVPLVSLLAEGYAFYDADGNLVSLAEGQTQITEAVTVAKIEYAASVTIGDTVTCYMDFAQAMSAAKGGTVEAPALVTLLKDMELSPVYFPVEGGVMTLELNGKTLSNCLVVNNCQLTIQDTPGGGRLHAGEAGVALAAMESTVTLTGGTIDNGTGLAVEIHDGSYIQTGGTVYGSMYASPAQGLLTAITISGGTVQLETEYSNVNAKVISVSNAQLTISGGAIIGNHMDMNQSEAQITGGSFPGYGEYGYLDIFNTEGSLQISGGSFPGGIGSSDAPLSDYLAPGHSFFDESGNAISLGSETLLPGPVTVQVLNTVSVDITWGAMEFTYSDGTWDADTLTYEGRGWTVDTEGGNTITVKNTGSEAVTVSVSYIPAEGYTGISGTFGETSATLSGEEEKKFWLLLSGKPENEMSGVPLGTVTVTIGGE